MIFWLIKTIIQIDYIQNLCLRLRLYYKDIGEYIYNTKYINTFSIFNTVEVKDHNDNRKINRKDFKNNALNNNKIINERLYYNYKYDKDDHWKNTSNKQIIEIVNNNIKYYYNKKVDKSYDNLLKESDD